jgi:hypothetical protein
MGQTLPHPFATTAKRRGGCVEIFEKPGKGIAQIIACTYRLSQPPRQQTNIQESHMRNRQSFTFIEYFNGAP